MWSNMMGNEHNEQLSYHQLLDTPGDSPAVSESRHVPKHKVDLPLHIYCIILCDQVKHFIKFMFFSEIRKASGLPYLQASRWHGRGHGHHSPPQHNLKGGTGIP